MATLASVYERIVLAHPARVLVLFALLLLVASLRLDQFRLDASAESLTLEDDQALEQFRETSRRFDNSEDFLVVTYSPAGDLFTSEAIARLRSLRDELAALEAVGSTNSILSVPLLYSPELTLDNVDSELRTLDEHEVPLDTARAALLNNPLYPDLLISEDGRSTAIQLNLPTPERYYELLYARNDLRDQANAGGLSAEKERELDRLENEFIDLKAQLTERQDRTIAEVRSILQQYRDSAELHLGGIPMIVADMIDFIESDLSTFGLGVLLFMILTLALIFRQWQWVAVPLMCCLFTVWLVTGCLSWVNWPVTVISSNYISLLLIMTLSLTIHLIVRYREYQHANPAFDERQVMMATASAMVRPCFYMTVTTIVAFGSLTFSGIRPVIDFGWMMTMGMAVAFFVAFVVFPALLVLMPPPLSNLPADSDRAFTRIFASLTERYGGFVLWGSVLLDVLFVVGITRLSVENSFIDYFKSDTEIHQGMITIDRALGGTAPLDLVINDEPAPEGSDGDAAALECDPFLDECEAGDEWRDTWFTPDKMSRLEAVHNYLDGLQETGKTLSIVTTLRLLKTINEDRSLDAVQLAFVPKVLPEDLASTLLDPYISETHDQARLTVRLRDSSPTLRRDELLKQIEHHMTTELGYERDEFTLTGMTVMYNNMLQSLFDSQIKTLGIVFLAIAAMFLIIFRSFKLALIGIAPNLLAPASMLGLMGWLNIPLDMMTITVAAIVVGIAVDDTIHYIHRFGVEFDRDQNYLAAMHRSHQSIGRAMFYTSLTIVMGFSILVLSNFIPTIYFGLFTGFAMIVAMVASLTLLPKLILMVKPFGSERSPVSG
ncbi:efflux RND transporter permease subunit [Allohahella marinimesophila]|uniref:RND family transporter n=1 Tax=Allohahella marinimesophila TaxID=1054972 RepID=A0ABP7PZK0_9GAMM